MRMRKQYLDRDIEFWRILSCRIDLGWSLRPVFILSRNLSFARGSATLPLIIILVGKTHFDDFADDLAEALSSDSFKEMASETVEGVPGGLRSGDGDSASSH